MKPRTESTAAIDAKKRSFVKFLGVGGLLALGATLLPNRANAVTLGGARTAAVTGFKNVQNAVKNPAKEETLTLVRNATDTLSFDASQQLNVAAASNFHGRIQNASNVSVNPATQATLASVKTATDGLRFSRGTELNTTGAAPSLATSVNVKDTTSANVTPAQLESAMLWRRMVKIMESQASADVNIMQRVTIDSFSVNVDVGPGVTGANTPLVAIASDAGNVVTGITTPTSFNGWNQQMFADMARDTYARGIRNRLAFS